MPIRAGCLKLSPDVVTNTRDRPRTVAFNQLRFEDWGSRESEEAARARVSGPGQHYRGWSPITSGELICVFLNKTRPTVQQCQARSGQILCLSSNLRICPGLKWAAGVGGGWGWWWEWSLGHRVRMVSWSGQVTTDISQTPRRLCGVSVSGHYQQDDTISVCVCIKYVSHFQYYLNFTDTFSKLPIFKCQFHFQ